MKTGKLKEVSGIGKVVTARDKYTQEKMRLGQTVDEVAVLEDDENKYVIQLIRLFHPIDGQDELYRIAYYTERRDGRLCLGSQYSPMLTHHELNELISQARGKGWVEVGS